MNKGIRRTTLCGNQVSDYGKQMGYVDYACLAKCFNHILCNDILNLDDNIELENGTEYNENDNPVEVFQYYIIDHNGAELLKDMTDEIIWYLPRYDLYVWGVTHFGTSWDYVLTNIRCNMGDKANG